ncbi:MAG: hypothetical protein M3O02_09410 [Acidobacteriota bacterium]|nr:hypothetical protein [Acidobacteriota bacterium]
MGEAISVNQRFGIETTIVAPEKFAANDLSSLRDELLQSGLDSWQAAELIGAFLSIRGYGVSNHAARSAATRIESVGCSLKCMQEELEKLALVM